MSPYWGKSFFAFFPLFFHRMVLLVTGQLSFDSLASDEIQILTIGCISIGAALIGTLLVLKRMTMLANSLSHTILFGIALAYVLLILRSGSGLSMNFSILFVAALISGLLTSLLTQGLHHWVGLQEDASIGLVFTSLFAVGILFVTIFTRNAHIGLEVVMGNADALHPKDVKLAAGVALINAVMLVVFFKEWRLISFDPALAANLGFRPALFGYLLMFLASGSAISAFRAVGVLLFLAFIVGLPVTARLITHNLKKMLLVAPSLGIACTIVGVALSRHAFTVYHLPLSTGGIVTCLIALTFLATALMKGLFPQLTFSKNSG